MQNTDGMEELEINLLILLTNKQTCFLHSTSWIFWYTRTGRYKSGNELKLTYSIFPLKVSFHSFMASNGIIFRPPAAKDLGSDPSKFVLSDMKFPWRIPRSGVCQQSFTIKQTISHSINHQLNNQDDWGVHQQIPTIKISEYLYSRFIISTFYIALPQTYSN